MCYETMSSVAKITSVIGDCMSLVHHPTNDTDREKLEYLEKNLSQCNFVHNKSHRDQPGTRLHPQ